MNLRKINTILLILSSSIFLFLMIWIVIYNVIFPVPNMLDLVPNDVIAYFDVHNLHKVLSSFLRSEFTRRVVQSPLWDNFQTTSLWNEINTEFNKFKQLGIGQGVIFRLFGKHSIVAFYLDPKKSKIDYILISELDIPTRLTLSYGQIKKFISPEYEVTKLKYKGKTITTAKSDQEMYSYTFIGRLGILSDDETLVQKVLDIYKDKKNGLAKKPEFMQISNNLPLSDVSFFINNEKLPDLSKSLEKYGLNYKNIPIIRNVNMISGVVLQGNGKTGLDITVLHRKNDNLSKAKNIPPFPKDCLALAVHRLYAPRGLFNWLSKNISTTFSIIGDVLLPTINGNVAEAVVLPAEGVNFPSILLYMQVKSRALAEAKLNELKYLLKLNDAQVKFAEKTYKNSKITYSSYITGVNFPVGFGYAFISDNILLVSTNESSMEEVVGVLNGDELSFTEQNQYIDVMPAISGKTDEILFTNLREMSPIIEQMARLYLFQGMFTGSRSGEKIAGALADNAFILGSWDYLGAVWDSKDNITNFKLILTRK